MKTLVGVRKEEGRFILSFEAKKKNGAVFDLRMLDTVFPNVMFTEPSLQ